jgi:hypothetical protein
MARSQMHPETAGSAEPAWHAPLPRFEVERDADLRRAVLDDASDLLQLYGEFPTPARYRHALDPQRDATVARELLAFAFECAPAAASELADCWKRDFPEWSAAIDHARAVAIVLEEFETDGIELDAAEAPVGAADSAARVGPLGPDGRGRYELTERLGAGSSGLVYRAVDHVLSQCGSQVTVAVKVIGCSEADIDACLREAGAARAVSHGSLARVLDAGVAPVALARAAAGGRNPGESSPGESSPGESSPGESNLGESNLGRSTSGEPTAIFIVAEFIDGVPLYVWKACHPTRTAEDCARIARAVADAIESCHATGVVHGDISPANVLVEPSGSIRIVDFGLASWRGMAADSAPATDGAARDRRRIAALMRWLVRELSPSRRVRAAVDEIERWCAGLPARRKSDVGRTVTLAAAVVIVGAVLSAYFVARSRPSDPVSLIFGDALAVRPDLAELALDLLEDGMPTRWSDDVFATKVRAVREEATAARRRGQPSGDLELLAALAVLPTPERLFARPFAALAVDGRLGSADGLFDRPAIRRELAWAIAWSFEAGGGAAPPAEAARINALARRLSAPGLFRLLQVETTRRE